MHNDKSMSETFDKAPGLVSEAASAPGTFEFLDTLHDMILVLDRDFVIRFANKALKRCLGFQVADLLDQSLGASASHLNAAFSGQRVSFLLNLPVDGSRRFQVTATPVRSEAAGLDLLYLVFHDEWDSTAGTEELIKSHERYKALIEQSSEGIWRFELENPIPVNLSVDDQIEQILATAYLAECNDAMAQMYGFECGREFVGAKLNELFLDGDADNIRMLRSFIEHNYRLPDVETVERDRYGQIVHFRNNLIGFVENGKLVRGWGTQKNITEEVRTREAMRKSEKRLRMASESGRVGIWEWDVQSGKLFWSDHVKDIYGFARDQKPSMEEYRAAIHPDDREAHQARIEAALAAGETVPYTSEHRIIVRGEIKWVLGSGEVVFDESGRPISMCGTVIDITARKRAEEKAILLNELGRSLSKAITTPQVTEIIERFAVNILKADAFAVYEMQKAKLEIIHAHGYSTETLSYFRSLHAGIKLPFADAGFQARPIFLGKPEELQEAYPHLGAQGIQRRSICAIPLILNDRVVGVMGLSFNSARHFDAENQRFILTFADQCSQALERARLYDTERNARMDAEAASRAKSRFLANMSHEIRTPLGAILGFAELMNEPLISEEERAECIETILRNGQLLNKVINDILDLSKIESERLEIEHIDFDLVPLVEEVIDLLRLKAREKSLRLELQMFPGLPQRIHSDPTRLRQILVNLISNAIKFTEQGSVEVLIEPLATGTSLQLRFSIKDTGIGVTPEEAERIFEPFVQADSSTTRKFGGTGLGLSVSRSLARALGGELFLAGSEPGRGSCFAFTMNTRAAEADLGKSSSTLAKHSVKELTGIRVLLVDDGADNLLLISRILSGAGADVTTANNGIQAVAMAQSQDFDIVVMDIQMPGMDGITAIGHLRELGYAKPCLALTAYAMKGDREQCLRAGFAEHLVKPLDRRALIQSVKVHAHRR